MSRRLKLLVRLTVGVLYIKQARFADVLCSYEKWGSFAGIGSWYCILILGVLHPFVLFNRAIVVDKALYSSFSELFFRMLFE
jgi:hypothetical protein